MYKYQQVFCSQCGQGFGPGDNGFSSCRDHSWGRPAHNFDFTFAWEVLVPIGGGHDEVSCVIGVDVVIDCCGDLEVECTVVDFQHQPWPELDACLNLADREAIEEEAERLALAVLAKQSEFNRFERYAPKACRA